MASMLTGIRPYLLLTLLCLAFFLPGQTAMPPTDRDEARFIQATRQMVTTGDYVDIRFQDKARHKKPAGIYWLQAASVKAFGDPDGTAVWPYRIPSVIGAILAVLLTFATGATLFDRKVAFLGAALLGSSMLLVIEAHIAKTDAMLLAAIMAGQLALARIWVAVREGRPPGWVAPLGFWAALGVTILLKGPIGPMVLLLTAVALRLIDRQTKFLMSLKPLIGIPLAVAIVAPWAIAISQATDGAFVGNAVKGDLLPKLISGQESHGFPPGYFLFLMTGTFWPGSILVWHGIVWAWRQRVRPEVKYLIAWVVPSWIVFELVPTKLPHYILPLYPALALVTARAAFALAEGGIPDFKRWYSTFGLSVAPTIGLVIAVGLVALPIGVGGGFEPVTLIPLAAALVGGAFALRYAIKGRLTASLVAGMAGAVFIMGPMWQFVLPRVDAIWLARSAKTMVERQITTRPLPAIAATGFQEPSLVFMLGTEIKLIRPEAIAAAMAKDPAMIALVGDRNEEAFKAAIAKTGITVRATDQRRGFNYSKGHWVTLKLYRREPATQRSGVNQ